MKMKSIAAFYVLLFVLVSTLGCLESNHLSSDFTPTGANTFSVINDSNIVVFHTCEKEKVNLNLRDKYIVKGNITNIGDKTIFLSEVNVSFYNRNKNLPFSHKDTTKSVTFIQLKPQQTFNFTLDDTYVLTEDIRYYKINAGYQLL
ncbi:hypothetical protein [Methanolobus sp.]|uniref:hypothetical protein n=1 Tax=Methanolobus sp. TaxID=1874737 RepID=UPI0025F862FE|nr:hypothetical protein [Methanolobus sp.]